MPGVHAAAPPDAPPYAIARPAPPAHAIERRQLTDRLDRVIGAHRVTLVVAPAGYGKTAALSAWAEQCARPVAWLSLTSFDKHPQRLEQGLLTALGTILESGAKSLPDLLRRDLDQEAVLVLDDVHVLGAASASVLGVLVDQGPPRLHVVLAARQRPLLRLQRINAAGGLGVVRADELAFTATEIAQAARRLDRPLTTGQVSQLMTLTAGWPVAVRLALMSAVDLTARLVTGGQLRLPTLADYLLEEVLGDLPQVLRDFLLTISVSDWLTTAMAVDLSGDSFAGAMLEDAISRGIPLERRGRLHGDPVYNWHPLVAELCRGLLRRQDPSRAAQLHLRAARLLAGLDHALAARHALAGDSPQLAAEILTTHWLSAVLRGDFAVLEEVCLQLPPPWSDDPDVLSIRATCRSAEDDPERAAQLRRRARVLAQQANSATRARHDLTALLSDLLVADDGDELVGACQRARDVLTDTTLLGGSGRACAWFLVAFAEVRLRRTRSAVPALREAAALARANGLDDIAARANANLIFALAFNGEFADADALLREFPGDDHAQWRRTEGRPEWFAAAWICFWRAEDERASELFAACISSGGATTSFATMARVWSASLAAASGNRARREASVVELATVSGSTVQGLPLGVYKAVAQAQLALADRRADVAVKTLDAVLPGATDIPSSLAFAAEVYLSCGHDDAARSCLAGLRGVATLPRYVRVAAAVVEALLADRQGQPENAHLLLENALELAHRDRMLRPFVRADPRLPTLLAAHAQRGTAHQDLIASALARLQERAPASSVYPEPLSAREREVLGYLQSGLSRAEIAGELYISENTLKTHMRSIYRKLGVSNRRDAIRATRPIV